MRRVSVVGNSGSGKTTVGRALATALGVPFVELDSIFHQPGWQPLDTVEFRRRVSDVCTADGWVVDGNYSAVRDLIWARADTVVWFDLPRRTVMRQLLFRTLRRGLTGAELWNGNREHLRNLLNTDPEESILRWAWAKHETYGTRYRTASADPRWSALTFVRVASRADARRLLERAGPSR
ncbi:shikimate kinase [Dactylosporangium sp. AC04546]|uniref:shikimate kinase n=1 Tax=Dactylosporangium sp. AC04546 TaxID=2862460 RepID=UPI001EDEBC18|nr:shikimate kinase [Dactylosporangium sp. AC04546]WVK87605.1 shikimate kinase [Dactylosporangium sp. AC04546]